ncbi:hypothetical protein ABW19_dt0202957 [Dactylella cylindrospora]|nr:hypothetical protein ABW19_dt0202957 [Dactylella cylindrospora]
MASYNHISQPQAAQYDPAYHQRHHQSYAAPGGNGAVQQPRHYQSQPYPPKQNPAPPGTFQPGTKIRVGSHNCVVERYLSEGGFAHVYVVRIDQVVDGTDVAVLKRVAVPDKEALANMRTEVDTMKRLKGHRHIVKYIDSHASHLKGGGYEVFLLMEYCAGGGLIDFMNTRLQHRLTEPEVLKIFSDAAEGVACMHYLQPPLLHRDLKIENILITPEPRTYKLCDFGSSAEPQPPGKNVTECRLIEEDIQKHTTLQYRSPEMIDVFRGYPIDEKSDIWALGVLLYKLCYYTTPFEDQGQLAILNASFKYPSYPPFSGQVKGLIGAMLQEDPRKRPNIYEVVSRVCRLRNKEVPIKNIYENSQDRGNMSVSPSPPVATQQPTPALVKQAPAPPPKTELPQITQMRRGRPPKPDSDAARQTSSTSRGPSAKVTNDPFAALDRSSNDDDISSRFPSVEQFSLLHDQGARFDFNPASPESPQGPKNDLSTRVMQKLADQAFDNMPPLASSKSLPQTTEVTNTSSTLSLPETRKVATGNRETSPQRAVMVSQGTMTSLSPTDSPLLRSTSNERFQPSKVESISVSKTANSAIMRPSLGEHRSSSTSPYSPANLARRSFEPPRPVSSIGSRPPPSGKGRPKSTHIESNLEFLRDLDSSSRLKHNSHQPVPLETDKTGRSTSSAVSEHIESSVDFLRVLQQESDASKSSKTDKRLSNPNPPGPKHSKRGSINLTNTKSLLAGRFGEAFRRFESGGSDAKKGGKSPSPHASEFPSHDYIDSQYPDLQVSSTEIPAEIRREMEKRQLQEEERRVEAAAAAYKKSVAEKGAGGRPSRARAGSIQRKVHALLNEEGRTPTPRTAEGYGRYTDNPGSKSRERLDLVSPGSNDSNPGYNDETDTSEPASVKSLVNRYAQPATESATIQGSSATGSTSTRNLPPRPAPKPEKLRKPMQSDVRLQQTADIERSIAGLDIQESPVQSSPSANLDGREDELLQFRKRFPSLSGVDF